MKIVKRVRRQTGETTYCIYLEIYLSFRLNWTEIDRVYYITEPLWVNCSVSRKLDQYGRVERRWRHARSTELFETIEIHPEFLPLRTLSRLNIIFVANLSDYLQSFFINILFILLSLCYHLKRTWLALVSKYWHVFVIIYTHTHTHIYIYIYIIHVILLHSFIVFIIIFKINDNYHCDNMKRHCCIIVTVTVPFLVVVSTTTIVENIATASSVSIILLYFLQIKRILGDGIKKKK